METIFVVLVGLVLAGYLGRLALSSRIFLEKKIRWDFKRQGWSYVHLSSGHHQLSAREDMGGNPYVQIGFPQREKPNLRVGTITEAIDFLREEEVRQKGYVRERKEERRRLAKTL